MEQYSQQFSQQSTNQQQFSSQPQFTPQSQLSSQPQYQTYPEYIEPPKKKKSKVKIVILVVVIVILIGILALIITYARLNKEKESISALEFKEKMTDMGFVVRDATTAYPELAEHIYLADNGFFTVEFYDAEDEAGARYIYNTLEGNLESAKDGSYDETTVTFKNYSKRVLSADDKYFVISRIDDTVVYVEENSKHKSDIKDVLEQLGY